MVKLTPTGIKINTNVVWTSHNTGGVEYNTGVFCSVPSRVLWGYSDATVTKGWEAEATAHAVAAEYPHSTLNGTATYCDLQ